MLRPAAALPLIATLPLAWLGCAGLGDPATQPASEVQAPVEEIAELESAIARDHATLERLVTALRTEDDPPLYENPELCAIAARLTEQERRLEQLRRAAAP